MDWLTLPSALTLTQTSHLWLFFLLVLGIIALPGLDMAFVLGSTLVDGLRSGLAALAGVVAGGMVHTAMAGLGVGLALKAMPQLFNLLLVAGALYLVWIGGSLVFGASALGTIGPTISRPQSATFRRGLLTCLLNPKAYLFMAAVFPHFVRPEHGSLTAQIVAMGTIIALTQVVVYGAVVLGSVQAREWLHSSGRVQVRAGQAVGGLLVLGGLWTLWQGWRV